MSVSSALHRQRDDHARAISRTAMGFDGAAVGFDKGLGNGQAEAVSTSVAGARGIATVKALKDARQLGGWNAWSVVGDFHAAVPIAGMDAHAYYLALRTETNRVL